MKRFSTLAALMLGAVICTPSAVFAAASVNYNDGTAMYLDNPVLWPETAVVIGKSQAKILRSISGLDVVMISTNRCFGLSEKDAATMTLPANYYPAQGTAPREIYNHLVNPETTTLLKAIMIPDQSDKMPGFGCNTLIFAYTAKIK